MNNVWYIMTDFDSDGPDVYGIYKTEAKAREEFRSLLANIWPKGMETDTDGQTFDECVKTGCYCDDERCDFMHIDSAEVEE